jgi:hypothetical protein
MDATDATSHFGKQLQEIAARFRSLSLFAGKLVEITTYQPVYRGVLFHSNSPDLL